MPPENSAFRAGNVALIGKPNVGKSTLMNHIVGHKVSIVSNKPQTTRRRVKGIATTDRYQIVFIDTPGIHEPHNRLGRSMVEQARGVMSTVDAIVYVADGSHHPGEMDREIAKQIRSAAENSIPVIVCLNKMDLLKAEDVQRNVDAYTQLLGSEDYMLTTATQGHNVDALVDLIVSKLPERAPSFEDDEYTDQSSRFLTAELVREKILKATRDEIPHAVAVMVDEWEESDDFTRIMATILVEKSSQRGILIGKQGAFLKNVGTQARQEVEALLGHRIYLELHVKVSEGWRQNPRMLHELEYAE